MSTYRQPDGTEILVCDTCGKDPDGATPDLSKAVKFDLTAEMLAAGFPVGTRVDVRDTCPACNREKPKP